MTRFIGFKNDRICVVSDTQFFDQDLTIIEVPIEFLHISAVDLLINCYIRNGQIKCKNSNKHISKKKIALVGNWKMQCGIATYSEHLWPQVIKHIDEYKLFIEKNDIKTGNIHQIGDLTVPNSQVVECWRRGESLQELVSQLKEYDPDIIWIQHEFGLWPNARYWLSMMTQLSEYRVIITMHSVFHHQDKTIVEAAMPEIVVHLEGGRTVLKNEKEISSNVYVIPHGCYPLKLDKLWNYYKSDKTFLQFGFGFRYKGWENSIKATALLKEKYPDVFFTGLFSESPYNKNEHQIYYNELMNLVNQLSLQENIAIIRGFQSDTVIDSFLRTNQATIFPYVSSPEHEVFGASGASRMAMSKGLPVITSSVNHFSDLPSLKADSPEDIAKALEKMFTDPVAKQNQINIQIRYLTENTWENIGLKYIELFENEINDKKR